MNDSLKKAVEEKNLVNIHNALSALTFKDEGFYTDEFENTLREVESYNIEGLFDKFDGEEFKPESEWNKEYWAYLNASLIDNFCPERIEMLKKVGRKVYTKKQTAQSTAPKYNNYSNGASSGRVHTSGHNYHVHKTVISKEAKVIGAGVVAVAIGCATVGPAATVCGIVVAGGVGYLCHKVMK